MAYTRDWNNEFVNTAKKLNLNNLDLCLEIGCFEGLTSNFIVKNILSEKGQLICVDPLTDQYLNIDLREIDIKLNQSDWLYFKNQYERFIENTKDSIELNKIKLYRNISTDIFPELIKEYENKFDLIYVDGDHRATYVYLDAINSFKLCKSGGIIIFDDYTYGDFLGDEKTSIGVDKFLNEYSGKYTTESSGYQYIIKKI
jgi:hypothetical protein